MAIYILRQPNHSGILEASERYKFSKKHWSISIQKVAMPMLLSTMQFKGFEQNRLCQTNKCGLTQRALDAGDSAAFSSIFLASSFLCSQAKSTPAPAPVTQTVGQQGFLQNKIAGNWARPVVCFQDCL